MGHKTSQHFFARTNYFCYLLQLLFELLSRTLFLYFYFCLYLFIYLFIILVNKLKAKIKKKNLLFWLILCVYSLDCLFLKAEERDILIDLILLKIYYVNIKIGNFIFLLFFFFIITFFTIYAIFISSVCVFSCLICLWIVGKPKH